MPLLQDSHVYDLTHLCALPFSSFGQTMPVHCSLNMNIPVLGPRLRLDILLLYLCWHDITGSRQREKWEHFTVYGAVRNVTSHRELTLNQYNQTVPRIAFCGLQLHVCALVPKVENTDKIILLVFLPTNLLHHQILLSSFLY